MYLLKPVHLQSSMMLGKHHNSSMCITYMVHTTTWLWLTRCQISWWGLLKWTTYSIESMCRMVNGSFFKQYFALFCPGDSKTDLVILGSIISFPNAFWKCILKMLFNFSGSYFHEAIVIMCQENNISIILKMHINQREFKGSSSTKHCSVLLKFIVLIISI